MTEIIYITSISILMTIIVFMIFYIRWLLKTIANIDNAITELWTSITSFNNHLNVIHETEMFYGDTTLQALIEHSKDLSENIEQIKDFFLPEDEGDYESKKEEE